MKISPSRKRSIAGFSLIEAIFTIAIIGIMSSIVVVAITSATRDANRIVARQQQATLNGALQAWVMGNMQITAGANAGQWRSLEDLRSQYNATGTTMARFLLISPDVGDGYLDPGTRQHFLDNTINSNRLETAALKSARQHLTLPNWVAGEFPKAMLVDNF